MPRKKRQLKDWLDSFLLYTDNSEPILNYRLWTGISTIASCLQRKCPYYFRPEFIIYPNFYIVLVGNSGSRKSTAITYGHNLMKEAGVILAPDSTSREKLMKEMLDCANYLDKDGETIMGDHHSLTLVSDELAVFLRHKDPDMLLLLISLYDCKDDFVRKTIGADSFDIGGMYLNILGGMTPSTLNEVLPQNTVGMGLTARMMFIYAHRKGKTISRPTITKREKLLREKLTHDLIMIKSLEGRFEAEEEFLEAYDAWYNDSELQHPARLIEAGKFDGYLGRRQTHLFKIAMVCSASRSDDLTIKRQDFDKALKILILTEMWMPETFSESGDSLYQIYVKKINLTLFQKHSMLYGDLFKEYFKWIDEATINLCLDALIRAGNITVSREKGYKKVTFNAVLTYTGRDSEHERASDN